jgi:hypothetical protein
MTGIDTVLAIPSLSPRARLLVLYLTDHPHAHDARIALALGCGERTVRNLKAELHAQRDEVHLATLELRS